LVSPSASNPGDGVSVVLLLSHQKGKKPKNKTNKKTKAKQNIPSSNAIQFQ
jgi:hypothetical protein